MADEAAKRPATGKKAPARSKPVASKAARARKPKLPKLKDVGHWVGLRVDGVGSRTLGRVAGLQVDVEDGEPRWVVLRLGPFAGCTAIPFEHLAEGAGRLWAAYERDWVREAPRLKTDEVLSADDELELCAHWGIRDTQGRSAELKGRAGDEVTAVPAEL
jgi:hypothetical protein